MVPSARGAVERVLLQPKLVLRALLLVHQHADRKSRDREHGHQRLIRHDVHRASGPTAGVAPISPICVSTSPDVTPSRPKRTAIQTTGMNST